MDSVILPYPQIDMRVDDVDLKLESSNDGVNSGKQSSLRGKKGFRSLQCRVMNQFFCR